MPDPEESAADDALPGESMDDYDTRLTGDEIETEDHRRETSPERPAENKRRQTLDLESYDPNMGAL